MSIDTRHGQVGQWTNGQMDKWTNGQMDKWTNGQMDRVMVRSQAQDFPITRFDVELELRLTYRVFDGGMPRIR
jgi:hypothetical protein